MRSNPQLFSAVAYACQQQDRNVEAAEWYGCALVSEPGNAAMHFNRGLALQKAGLPAAAAESYRAALRVDPKLTEARKNLAIILLIFGLVHTPLPEPDYPEVMGGI